jgi:hypothetical protein
LTPPARSSAGGFNFNGELDLPVSQVTNNANPTPQLIGTEAGFAPWAAVAGGADFTVALTAAGVVGTVGNNSSGQLGNGIVDSTLNFSPSFGTAQVSGVNLLANAPAVPSTTLGVSSAFKIVGSSTTNVAGSATTYIFSETLATGTYTYRIRAVTTAGSSNAITATAIAP